MGVRAAAYEFGGDTVRFSAYLDFRMYIWRQEDSHWKGELSDQQGGGRVSGHPGMSQKRKQILKKGIDLATVKAGDTWGCRADGPWPTAPTSQLCWERGIKENSGHPFTNICLA